MKKNDKSYSLWDEKEALLFFTELGEWRQAIRQVYPKAKVIYAADSHICRAFLGKVQIGVFGRLPEYGVVVTEQLGKQLWGRNALRHYHISLH